MWKKKMWLDVEKRVFMLYNNKQLIGINETEKCHFYQKWNNQRLGWVWVCQKYYFWFCFVDNFRKIVKDAL